jgi:hypothetical protein
VCTAVVRAPMLGPHVYFVIGAEGQDLQEYHPLRHQHSLQHSEAMPSIIAEHISHLILSLHQGASASFTAAQSNDTNQPCDSKCSV